MSTALIDDETSVQVLPIDAVLPSDSPRLRGENAEHVKVLAQASAPLPPIVVHQSTMRVIDGMHRLRAAELRGAAEIAVHFFDGDEQAAFVLAVESNISHGLPLTLADRIAAAERILTPSPQWSDRAVAAKTGLAAGTVAGIRQRLPAASDQPSARVGKDGRVRPLNNAAGRRLASALMAERPDATLREIARDAGISAATALDVRARLGRGEDPVPRRQRESERSGLERRRAPTPPARAPSPGGGQHVYSPPRFWSGWAGTRRSAIARRAAGYWDGWPRMLSASIAGANMRAGFRRTAW